MIPEAMHVISTPDAALRTVYPSRSQCAELAQLLTGK